MSRRSVVLIGFQDQTNLGLGYLASALDQDGFPVLIVDFREDHESILETIRSAQPALVGFSLIFQYYLPQFAELASFLRANGVGSHFCAGGHYPTLRSAETLQQVPELDSVVLGEGELTLAELVACLDAGRDWRRVLGLAYREEGQCRTTPPRPLLADLDSLPYPVRPGKELSVLGVKTCPVLASRGCLRRCSFCSIRQFYSQSPGRKVRVRDPEKVVEEMRQLREKREISVFLFQDDDFPLSGMFGRQWVERFIDALRAADLDRGIIWKVSCRADEVQPELFAKLREAGLFMVYLGLESGNTAGLNTFRKGLGVEDNLRAVKILKELGLSVGFGFMLFDPSSTFETVRANVSFLRQITGDGSTAAHFCRMVPYAGTPIEAELAKADRLRGDATNPDYSFLDPRMEDFFAAVSTATTGWINGSRSLKSYLNWAWQEYWVLRRLFPPLHAMEDYARSLESVTRRSNKYLLDLVANATDAFEVGSEEVPSATEVEDVSRRFTDEVIEKRDAFILQHQETLLNTLAAA
jgi:radical SAM superfamily enzyme YgiQ (UPF0313 family)